MTERIRYSAEDIKRMKLWGGTPDEFFTEADYRKVRRQGSPSVDKILRDYYGVVGNLKELDPDLLARVKRGLKEGYMPPSKVLRVLGIDYGDFTYLERCQLKTEACNLLYKAVSVCRNYLLPVYCMVGFGSVFNLKKGLRLGLRDELSRGSDLDVLILTFGQMLRDDEYGMERIMEFLSVQKEQYELLRALPINSSIEGRLDFLMLKQHGQDPKYLHEVTAESLAKLDLGSIAFVQEGEYDRALRGLFQRVGLNIKVETVY